MSGKGKETRYHLAIFMFTVVMGVIIWIFVHIG